MQPEYDVVIVGGGVAGLSAALYTVRAQLKTVVVEKFACGGQILYTDEIENYPGFPDGIKGPELAQLLERQVAKFGARVEYDDIQSLDVAGPVKVARGVEREFTARALILASGGEHNKLGVPGEEEFAGRGVSYCATCDGNFFANQDVVVVGGGDAAVDEGLYLTRIVNRVTVVHRRDQLRASRILQERAFANPKMKFLWNHVVQEIRGNGAVQALVLKDVRSEKVTTLPAVGVFIYIGFHPGSAFIRGSGVELDRGGHVVVDLGMGTTVPGVFAAGDLRQFSDRQLGTAVGDGITAALSAYSYITGGH